MKESKDQSPVAEGTRPKALPRRREIDVRHQWNLRDIYDDADSWERDFTALTGLIDELKSYRDRLGESAGTLLDCLRLRDRLGETILRLYVYAHLWRDEDTANIEAQALSERIARIQTRAHEAGSFFSPEILALPDGKLDGFLEESEDLRVYRHALEDIVRTRTHTLSPPEEKILALAGNVTSTARNIFHMLNNADIRFPAIRDEEGNEVEVTKGRFSRFMESTDRRVRADAYEALLGSYRKSINTFAAALAGSVTRDLFYARARGYDSCLSAALDGDNIPAEVFESTIGAVGRHAGSLRRYLDVRKRILGYDELRPYDLFVPLFPESREETPYEEAVGIIRKGLAPLGPEYGEVLGRAFRERWIDVHENEGKRSGAYSWGVYGVHPYVLLNYQETLDDVFTIAHELGHSLHTYYSTRTQPYIYSDYSIFTAEVASTTNEALLMHHLLEKTADRARKLYLLNHWLDQIRGTVFTQVLFADFERRIHRIAEEDEPLTADVFGNVFLEVYDGFYGDRVARGENQKIYWARVPHFYNAFYVYQYATGYAAATALSQRILTDGGDALEAYLGFLKAGSSRYPIEILEDAGVDMTGPGPITETVRLFDRLLDELESLLDG
ncbi:MAG: oligoendopeptidase F [Candidatus Eisenbacteria bacterium]